MYCTNLNETRTHHRTPAYHVSTGDTLIIIVYNYFELVSVQNYMDLVSEDLHLLCTT